MAHAKTSLSQVLAQVGIGASVAFIYWTSLSNHNNSSSTKNGREDILAELDRESKTSTSGKHWGLEQRAQEANERQNQTAKANK